MFPKNCQLHSTEGSSHKEICVRIVYEAVQNMAKYLDNAYVSIGAHHFYQRATLVQTFAMYAEDFNPLVPLDVVKLYKQEVMEIKKLAGYMGIWQLFQMANILRILIQSVYLIGCSIKKCEWLKGKKKEEEEKKAKAKAAEHKKKEEEEEKVKAKTAECKKKEEEKVKAKAAEHKNKEEEECRTKEMEDEKGRQKEERKIYLEVKRKYSAEKKEEGQRNVTFAMECEVFEVQKSPGVDNSHPLDDTLYPPEPVLNLHTPELKAMEYSMEKLLEEHDKQIHLVIDMSGCLGDERECYMCSGTPSFTDENILSEKVIIFA